MPLMITYRATDLRSSNGVLNGTVLDQLSGKYSQALLLWSTACMRCTEKSCQEQSLQYTSHILYQGHRTC